MPIPQHDSDARGTRWLVGGFPVLWCFGALVKLQVNFLACQAENLEIEDGSANGFYCHAIRDFLNSGEPSESTTPLPYVLPVAVLAAFGGYGVWRASKAILSRAAIAAVCWLVAHVILLIVLPG